MADVTNSDRVETNPSPTRGYRPLQGGYTPMEKKGYPRGLPVAPKGGTGQVPSSSSPNPQASQPSNTSSSST
jgi:hypothetical protein